MPQSGGGSTTLHRWHRMVRQVLHEHETALSAASPANRSRGLIKCAKKSARYRLKPPAPMKQSRCSRHNETTVDVVFTDIEMPGIVDGFGLAKWIREHRPGMDVHWPVRCRALSKTPRNFVKKARCRSLMTIRLSTTTFGACSQRGQRLTKLRSPSGQLVGQTRAGTPILYTSGRVRLLKPRLYH